MRLNRRAEKSFQWIHTRTIFISHSIPYWYSAYFNVNIQMLFAKHTIASNDNAHRVDVSIHIATYGHQIHFHFLANKFLFLSNLLANGNNQVNHRREKYYYKNHSADTFSNLFCINRRKKTTYTHTHFQHHQTTTTTIIIYDYRIIFIAGLRYTLM